MANFKKVGVNAYMDYESKHLDHLGIVAAACREIGIVEEIDKAIPPDPRQRLTTGECFLAMIINGLGFTSRPLSLTPQYFKNKPIDLLIKPGISAEEINDDVLGRAMDTVFENNDWPGAWGLTVNNNTKEVYLCYNNNVFHDSGTIKTAVFSDNGLVRMGADVITENQFGCDLAYDEHSGDVYLLRTKEFNGSWNNENLYIHKSSDQMNNWIGNVQVNNSEGDYSRQSGLNFSSSDRIYAWYVDQSKSDIYGNTIKIINKGADRLNPKQSAADWFHFVGF